MVERGKKTATIQKVAELYPFCEKGCDCALSREYLHLFVGDKVDGDLA